MSAIVADSYRGFAIHYSSPDQPNDHDLTVYDPSQSRLRNKLMNELPFPSEGTPSSYGTQPQAVLPYPAPHTSGHHESQSSYITAHQMIHQPVPPPYGYDLPSFSGNRKRKRSGSIGDGGRNMNPNVGMHQSMSGLPPYEPSTATEPPEIHYPGRNDHASSHRASGHDFASSISLPLPQQHHHHRLPPEVLLYSGSHNLEPGSSTVSGEVPNVVGRPGMPQPARRPRGPKPRFTPDDDRLIIELKEEKKLSWKQIADFFPGRSNQTLQVRYCTKLKVRHVVWTDDSDGRLLKAINEYENERWQIIATKLGKGFTPAACKDRALHLEALD